MNRLIDKYLGWLLWPPMLNCKDDEFDLSPIENPTRLERFWDAWRAPIVLGGVILMFGLIVKEMVLMAK